MSGLHVLQLQIQLPIPTDTCMSAQFLKLLSWTGPRVGPAIHQDTKDKFKISVYLNFTQKCELSFLCLLLGNVVVFLLQNIRKEKHFWFPR